MLAHRGCDPSRITAKPRLVPMLMATGLPGSRLRGRSRWPCNGAIMKRRIIVAAAAISMTGAASANLPVLAPPSPREKPAAATEAPVVSSAEIYAKAQALVARPAAPSERSGENAARAAIEADGYKGVQELRRGENGTWHAKAFRGRSEVRLIVDARGAVTTAD